MRFGMAAAVRRLGSPESECGGHQPDRLDAQPGPAAQPATVLADG